jgi:signal transduction histidine kinase
MAKCFMCGAQIARGILCEKCDKPRKPKAPESAGKPAAGSAAPAAQRSASSALPEIELELDPFPKAPVVPFPVESASPAVTSIVTLLTAAGVPAVLLAPDRSVKFVTDEAKRLFDASQADTFDLPYIELRAGVKVGDLSAAVSSGLRIHDRQVHYSLVPISGGAAGAVLVFRDAEAMRAHPSFQTFIRETVFGPLRSLRDALAAAARTRGSDPLLHDSAATLDQVLSSLELAPEVDEASSAMRRAEAPTIVEIVKRVAERFRPHADLKGIHLETDVGTLDERFADHHELVEALAILMDNALHYVPPGGQIVIGARLMEHKGKPLLLFFVMDNGPLVPEALRQQIFEPGFVWDPHAPERTGRGLFRAREFALAHGGSAWIESKSGKACTFFLRLRPGGAR